MTLNRTHIILIAMGLSLAIAAVTLASGQAPLYPLSESRSNAETATPTKSAKNVILFIGDGMGISTITAARIYDGQSRGESGEENLLSFEKFPNVALVKTYSSNSQVSDSAATASAMQIGVKTRTGVINTAPNVPRGDCKASLQSQRIERVADIAQRNGKAIGIVTTARLTHATPAAVYGYSSERGWEADSDLPETAQRQGCVDIARQLIAYDFHVALGGGRAQFFGKAQAGNRLADADNLPAEWSKRTGGHYVETATAMAQAKDTDKPLLGLFSRSHMTYMLDRKADSREPTLTEMTAKALAHLRDNEGGYYLMVEGGRIDHGHHEGKAGYALSETQEFARAVAYAVANVDLSETLILVTADHSHVMTMAGYAKRGNPILGLVRENDKRGEPSDKLAKAADGQPYTTLGYSNGPGAGWAMPNEQSQSQSRPRPEEGAHAIQQSGIPTGYVDSRGTMRLSETHGGEDVPLYAIGAGSHHVRGVIEQNKLAHIIRTTQVELGYRVSSDDSE